jgi:predicted DNA-binding WGR domain protein
MNPQRDIVLHYLDGNSDKVYISGIRLRSGGQFAVVGLWGRRGKRLAQQVKLVTGSRYVAVTKQQWLASEKKHKGYIDISSPEYHGDLVPDDPWLESYLLADFGVTRTSVLPEIKKTRPPRVKIVPNDERELICIDNKDYEKHFDIGVEYIGRSDNNEMYCVYDKFGDKIYVFKSRFKEAGERT